MKRRVFFFYYNKPASVKQGRNVLTVHWHKTCHLVHHLEVFVPVATAARKSQPRCVIKGRAESCSINRKLDGTIEAKII